MSNVDLRDAGWIGYRRALGCTRDADSRFILTMSMPALGANARHGVQDTQRWIGPWGTR